uniref:Putative secreted protein n=1 Tax=Amblyomma parvum TaxID=251391 RepID=A0A023G0A9_AMBPA
MLAIIAAAATLAIFVGAKTVPGSQPVDYNPDCSANDPEHVYVTCTFECGGDEMIALNNNETCSLKGRPTESTNLERSDDESPKGKCVDGNCV